MNKTESFHAQTQLQADSLSVYCGFATPFFFLPALGMCRMTSFSHLSLNFLYLPTV
jgi:hypothetical protein